MDAKRYVRFQGRGLTGFIVKQEKDESGKEQKKIYLTFKRFATDDGHEIEPEEQLINIPEIIDRISNLELEIQGLKLIRDEASKL